MNEFSKDELLRYSRHLALQDFGLEGQLRLRQAKVVVVGAGGLGSPALLYLAAAGIGTLGIVDFDRVEVSNLQRQVIFTVDDIGKNKADASANRLRMLNPHVTVSPHVLKLNSENAIAILNAYDVIIDGTDNFPTRYLLNDACILLGKPLVYGSILKFEGQLAVFNLKKADGSYSTNYRDLFPNPPEPGTVQNCAEAGVLGVLPGMIGSMQSNEAIKIITGMGEPLCDKLVILDSRSMEMTTFHIPDRKSREGIQSLIDYDDFCGLSEKKNKYLENKKPGMKEMTVQELKELKDSNADFQLIDVREPHEYDICNLEGELIPMAEIPSSVDRISKDKKVILHCRSGKRSGEMVLWLEKNEGFTNLYNLKGGVLAWAREIDPTMPMY